MTALKVVYCLRRLPELSRAQFQHYWTTVHAPLVARHAEVLGIVRYVQNHTLDDGLAAALSRERDSTGNFDGVAELWLQPPLSRSAEARRAADELLADERRFIDLANSPLFAVRPVDHSAAASTPNTSTIS